MRNRRSVAGQNLRREIFDIRRAAGFSSTVSLFRPLWGFHRPPAEPLAGNPTIRRHNRFAKRRKHAVDPLEVVSEIRILSAARTKESLDISNLDRIFSAGGRRSNALAEKLFSGLLGFASGISAPFRWKSESSVGNLKFSGCFESSAEDLKLQLLFQIFSDLLE